MSTVAKKNGAVIRLPAAVVEALDLKDGDQIEVRITGPREFEVSRDRTWEEALERLRRLRRPLPPVSASTGLPFMNGKTFFDTSGDARGWE